MDFQRSPTLRNYIPKISKLINTIVDIACYMKCQLKTKMHTSKSIHHGLFHTVDARKGLRLTQRKAQGYFYVKGKWQTHRNSLPVCYQLDSYSLSVLNVFPVTMSDIFLEPLYLPDRQHSPHSAHILPDRQHSPHSAHILPVRQHSPHSAHILPDREHSPHSAHILPDRQHSPHSAHKFA